MTSCCEDICQEPFRKNSERTVVNGVWPLYQGVTDISDKNDSTSFAWFSKFVGTLDYTWCRYPYYITRYTFTIQYPDVDSWEAMGYFTVLQGK